MPFQTNADGLLIDMPGLPLGQHDLTFTLHDQHLLYDNTFHWSVTVRDRVPVRVIGDRITSWSAAVLADQQRLEAEQWQVSDLSLRSWPEQGAMVLTQSVPEYREGLHDWLQQGGVVWISQNVAATADWASWFHADFSLPAALGGALRPASPALQGGMGNIGHKQSDARSESRITAELCAS